MNSSVISCCSTYAEVTPLLRWTSASGSLVLGFLSRQQPY